MKIALFTYRLSHGAFAQGYAALANGFHQLGISDIDVVYLNEGPGENVLFPESVNLVSLNVQRTLLSSIALAKFIRSRKPDILITMPAFINISAIIGWKLSNEPLTKLVISERMVMSYRLFLEREKIDLRWRLFPYLARILYPKASGVVTNSKSVLHDLIHNIRVPILPQQASVIYPAIDLVAITELSRKVTCHPWLKHKKVPVVVSVGRLAREKNFPLLLKAFKLVCEEKEARLIIIGEGEERKELEKKIGELGLDNVSLPGFLSNPWSSIARSDIFILTSEEEAFGRVIVEAMACGVPVIATDAVGGGPREILIDGNYGMLVPRNSPEKLAKSILEMLNTPSLRDKLEKGGRERSMEFDSTHIAKNWLSFIETLN